MSIGFCYKCLKLSIVNLSGSPFLLNVKGDAYEIEDENEEEREEHAYAATGELGKETFLHLAIPGSKP